ncbi:hypothetical protein Ancab_019808 [Ancistrocladus abbreviatus]
MCRWKRKLITEKQKTMAMVCPLACCHRELSSAKEELLEKYEAILPDKYKQSLHLISLKGIEQDASWALKGIEEDARSAVSFDEDKKWLWLDHKNRTCFRVFAKGLRLSWGSSTNYWTFSEVEFGPDAKIAVAELKRICGFEVWGTMKDLQMLTPTTTYEVFLELKMKQEARGWQGPVRCYFATPFTAEMITSSIDFDTQFPKDNQWKTLRLGKFTVPENPSILEDDMIIFVLRHYSARWKTGLVIRSLTIRAVD